MLDQNGLSEDGEDNDVPKDRVAHDALKYVALVSQLAHVDLIEQSHHDKHVKQHGIMNAGGFLVRTKAFLVSKAADVIIRREAFGTATRNTRDVIGDTIEEIKDNGNLVTGVKKDVPAHDFRKERLRAPVWLSIQQCLVRRFSRECEGRK